MSLCLCVPISIVKVDLDMGSPWDRHRRHLPPAQWLCIVGPCYTRFEQQPHPYHPLPPPSSSEPTRHPRPANRLWEGYQWAWGSWDWMGVDFRLSKVWNWKKRRLIRTWCACSRHSFRLPGFSFAHSPVSLDFNARVIAVNYQPVGFSLQHAGLTVFMQGIVSCVTWTAMSREAEVLPAYET